jgi:hypothetical protein
VSATAREHFENGMIVVGTETTAGSKKARNRQQAEKTFFMHSPFIKWYM